MNGRREWNVLPKKQMAHFYWKRKSLPTNISHHSFIHTPNDNHLHILGAPIGPLCMTSNSPAQSAGQQEPPSTSSATHTSNNTQSTSTSSAPASSAAPSSSSSSSASLSARVRHVALSSLAARRRAL